MKEKYSSVASPQLLKMMYIEDGTTLAAIYVISAVIGIITQKYTNTLAICLLSTAVIAAALIIKGAVWGNAYRRFELDRYGVKNRFYEVRWEDIDEISLCSVVVRRYRRSYYQKREVELTSMVCIGRSADKFQSLDPQKTVFFALDKKNLEAMRDMSGGRSEKVNEFIEKYMGVI